MAGHGFFSVGCGGCLDNQDLWMLAGIGLYTECLKALSPRNGTSIERRQLMLMLKLHILAILSDGLRSSFTFFEMQGLKQWIFGSPCKTKTQKNLVRDHANREWNAVSMLLHRLPHTLLLGVYFPTEEESLYLLLAVSSGCCFHDCWLDGMFFCLARASVRCTTPQWP